MHLSLLCLIFSGIHIFVQFNLFQIWDSKEEIDEIDDILQEYQGGACRIRITVFSSQSKSPSTKSKIFISIQMMIFVLSLTSLIKELEYISVHL